MRVAGQQTEVVQDDAPEGTEKAFYYIEGDTSINSGNRESYGDISN